MNMRNLNWRLKACEAVYVSKGVAVLRVERTMLCRLRLCLCWCP